MRLILKYFCAQKRTGRKFTTDLMIQLRPILLLTGLVLVFYFGEIALSFSDRGTSYMINDEEVAFSLKLENSYSDFESTEVIDNHVESFMKRWKIKGMSVAVTKNEELVYAKGFGFADLEQGVEVKPGHLFRIASVSKLITAAAILKLQEEGRISLDDYVFGPHGILDTTLFPDYLDARYEEIRVRHLLNHTAGWSRRSGDPMFSSLVIARKMKVPPPAELDQVISYSLSRRLTYQPGTRYSYSNLGYAILGRIIEVRSGIPYEDFVIMNILKPAGIHDMHLGRSTYHERFPNEVAYYHTGTPEYTYAYDGSGKKVPIHNGGNNITLLGAAGGWVASAPELVKLITVLDGFGIQGDLLDRQTLEMMVSPEAAGPGLFGWRGSDSHGTWWRTGYLNGTAALVVRQPDGVNWVALMNTSTYRQSRIHSYTASMMFQALGRIEIWPYLNLFLVDQEIPEPVTGLLEVNPLL